MSIPLPEEENFKMTNNYYLLIKQISEDFSKYIINFKMISHDYLKKLISNNEKFNIHIFEKKYKDFCTKDLDLKHIFSISSIIPVVIEQQIINLEFFVKGIDEKIENFEKIFNEKSSLYLEQYNNYKDVKKELSNKYREIEKLKVNYITNISSVEEMVHKFYMKKNNNKKRLNSISATSLIDSKKEAKMEQNNISIEEQLNNNIQKVKKIEEDYKINIALVKSIEDKYTKISKESKENIRRILCEFLNGYKDYIFDVMLFLKNCYKLPLSEIDTYMEEIIKLDESDNFNNIIISSYTSGKKFQTAVPQKYTLKFFKKNKKNNFNEDDEIIKLKRSNSTSLIKEEGFQETDYFHEQEIFLTIKKMMENFDLLDNNGINLTIEEEKLRCKFLSLKILTFTPISKLYSDKIPPITDEEVDELEKMIDKKINRIIFIQKLSQFRNRGFFKFLKENIKYYPNFLIK